jgi:hypothetical protein
VRDRAHEIGLDLLDEPVAGDVAEGEDASRDSAERIAHHRLRDREPNLLAAAVDRDEPVAARPLLRGLEAPLQHFDRRAAKRNGGRDAGDPLGSAVPEDDLALAIHGDDAVGDVREDRDRTLALDRHALVELCVRERGGRARGDGKQRVDLLLPPLPPHRRVDGEDAHGRSLGAPDGDAEESGMACSQHRVEAAQALVLARLRERDRGA